MFDLELERVSKWISDGGYASVAVQLPEGLKIRAPEISDYITKNTGASVLVIGRPCYGACDLFDHRGWADAIVHYGHSRIPSMGDDPNVLYVEARSDADLEGTEELLKDLPPRVGILATIQYIGLIPELKRIVESTGRTAVVGEGDGRIAYPGQVLGCNCTAAESVAGQVDCFVYIGEGAFHPLAAAFGADRDVYVLNPATKELTGMSDSRDRTIRRRFAAIQTASNAQTFLIIICSKIGQCRRDTAAYAEKMIREAGRGCVTAVMEEVTPDSLASYMVDAYVCTACPRIAMDDSARYGKPMLTVPELEVALGVKEWDSYPFDQIRGRSH
ncbi:MAG: diphthamide biosynthesis enzyme Dph2 [Thermoplasmata archaeon]|nr:diphthamide biosynthesis enzyme Dph2 [Thermoplasmata archaeon]